VRDGYYYAEDSKVQTVSFGLGIEPVYTDVSDLSEVKAVAPPEPRKVIVE
jgi:hypothetical protein